MTNTTIKTVTETQYALVPADYRGVWTTERLDIPDWEAVRERYMGKRTLVDGGVLLIEGQSLGIVPDRNPRAVLARIASFLTRAGAFYLHATEVQTSRNVVSKVSGVQSAMMFIDRATAEEVVVRASFTLGGRVSFAFSMTTGELTGFVASRDIQDLVETLCQEVTQAVEIA